MKLFSDKKGSGLLITMFMLSGILVIAMGGSYITLAGVKSGTVQYQSSRAYFAAEAGAERALWEVRKNEFDLSSEGQTDIFGTVNLNNGGVYNVDYNQFQPDIVFTSIGDFGSTRRSVELTF